MPPRMASVEAEGPANTSRPGEMVRSGTQTILKPLASAAAPDRKAVGMGSMAGRTCVVTGATGGIGKATAEGLLRLGARVVVVSRSPDKGAATVDELRTRTGSGDVSLEVADFRDLASVRMLATRLLESDHGLDVLVNNAGVMRQSRELTRDGYEAQWGVNHLAPFLLTNLLLPKLRERSSRVVVVASEMHKKATLDLTDVSWSKRKFSQWGAYTQSKLANVIFTLELARRLAGSNATANCLHPGVVASGIMDTASGFMGFAWKLVKPFLLSPEKGAVGSIHLASSEDVAGTTGKYFEKSKPTEPNPLANDPATGRALWDLSLEQAGLTAAPAS